MIREAIVLAGGLGTRLKPAVSDLPKSLAPIAGKPFLSYLLDLAGRQGIQKFVFALGHKAEPIEAFVKEYLPANSYAFSVEEEPLGTGGAIFRACKEVADEEVIVLNADTFFGVSFLNLSIIHELRKAECTLALKPMKSFDRYGAVSIEKQVITGFSEKKFQKSGLINGGVYALSTGLFLQKPLPSIFSFEKDYLEKEFHGGKIIGMISDAYFIDIGIPEDYERAQHEFLSQSVMR
jgi:D-glycero-alpha-D-manno-heptose 1-phosphate guanylyltransferase